MNYTIFERREAFNTLFYIADHPLCNKSDVMYHDGMDEMARARFLRITDLVNGGLVDVATDKNEDRPSFRILLTLSDKGRRFVDCVRSL